jgi:hypothetical protein
MTDPIPLPRGRHLLVVELCTLALTVALVPVCAMADETSEIARRHLYSHRKALGLSEAEVADLVVADQYVSRHTGITHVVLQQRLDGIEVLAALVNVTISGDGTVLGTGNRLVPDVFSAATSRSAVLSPHEAVVIAAAERRVPLPSHLPALGDGSAEGREIVFDPSGATRRNPAARLVYLPLEDGSVRLAWLVGLRETSGNNHWQVRVDAVSGEVLAVSNLVGHLVPPGTEVEEYREGHPAADPMPAPGGQSKLLRPDSYKAYPVPMESPMHLIPPLPDDPPLSEDHRTTIVNPASSASPFGWHDTDGVSGEEYTITRGNNVYAYQDSNASNSPMGDDPDGGPALEFIEPIDLTQEPSTYQPASVIDLFFWTNIAHDVFHGYGFDEPAGNFQENNYGNGGAGSDFLIAEAQDGGATCDVRMTIQADGLKPRMEMFICDLASPSRDGGLDHGVVLWAYGWGMAQRLAGGPGTVFCLDNSEAMLVGWNDYIGLWTTIENGDAGTDSRGFGTYLLGEASTGSGLRLAPYSTDMAVNDYTYADVGSVSVPHGVGFVWAIMVWDMTWDLIDEYGFDPDLYTGTGGNNLAMQLVIDGLKLQPCSPGFVDGRDAILLADQILTAGANQCTIWKSFARRGLGFSASQGSSNSVGDETEAFDMHPACPAIFADGFESGDTSAWSTTVGEAP